MCNKKMLIDIEYALQQIEIGEFEHRGVFESDSSHIKDFLNALPTVDAVLVDEIRLHHILIDNEGVPEVKLQIGDRYFVLRTDPVDVTKVVHGRWVQDGIYDCCSVCNRVTIMPHLKGLPHFKYCPNCGAKMDGGN